MHYQNLVIKDTNTAVVGITVFKQKILFLKRKKPPLNWCPPCGRVELNESLEDALIREVKEETNLSIEKYKFVSYWEGKFFDKPIKSFLYVCKVKSVEVALSKNEHTEYSWVEIKELDKWQSKTDFDLINWKKWIDESLVFKD